jgi:hypothetical protein
MNNFFLDYPKLVKFSYPLRMIIYLSSHQIRQKRISHLKNFIDNFNKIILAVQMIVKCFDFAITTVNQQNKKQQFY